MCCADYADDEGLQLASRQFTASDGLLLSITVKMGMLELEASFDSLAWAGTPVHPKARQFAPSHSCADCRSNGAWRRSQQAQLIEQPFLAVQ